MNTDKIIDLMQVPVNLLRDSPREYSLKWSMKKKTFHTDLYC